MIHTCTCGSIDINDYCSTRNMNGGYGVIQYQVMVLVNAKRQVSYLV
jgi:hypothetical protein